MSYGKIPFVVAAHSVRSNNNAACESSQDRVIRLTLQILSLCLGQGQRVAGQPAQFLCRAILRRENCKSRAASLRRVAQGRS